MTLNELKKEIVAEFKEVEQELAGHPTPKINDNDCNPEYAYGYGQDVGKQKALAWVLGLLEKLTFETPKKKKKND